MFVLEKNLKLTTNHGFDGTCIKNRIMGLLIVVLMTTMLSCSNSFTDPRDGQVYKTVKIGNQTWMAENLNYTDGDSSYCYKDDSSNCEKYGRLYTWNAAIKAAPAGWHLPSKEEWEVLISAVGGEDTTALNNLVVGGNTGFNALTGIGTRDESGAYHTVGKGAYFWSSTPDGDKDAWYCVLSKHRNKVHMVSRRMTDGFPIRCIKD